MMKNSIIDPRKSASSAFCKFALICALCVICVPLSASLPAPKLKPGKATLKGTLTNYAPEMNATVKIRVANPVTGIYEDCETPVGETGAFELAVPLVCDAQVLLELDALKYWQYVLLSPGKTSTVSFDASQARFGGANAEINSQLDGIKLNGLIRKMYDDTDFNAVAEMTAGEYKSLILAKADSLIAELKQKRLTRKALEFAVGAVRYSAVHDLMFTRDILRESYRRLHHPNDNDPVTGFESPAIDEYFYSFLADPPVNDPRILYYYTARDIISLCKHLNKEGYSLRFTRQDAYQALIDSGRLSPEEMETAVYLKDNALDNPANRDRLKSRNTTFLRTVINTGKLNGKLQEEARRIIAVCERPSTSVPAMLEEVLYFQEGLTKNGNFTEEEMVEIFESINSRDTVSAKFPVHFVDFDRKYREELDLLSEQIAMREKRAFLARILGADSGIAFDLIESQSAAKRMEELIPLTADDLRPFAQKKHPFYLNYLTAKNKELLAKIEANRLKVGYAVHDTPAAEGAEAFEEIVRKFPGKVILVDFWNTWCGPCRSAMKEFEPAKNRLKEKGAVFIYLADESSPVNAWNNMIAGISGEHFRLNDSQKRALHDRFGIRGIPFYLILNRQGEQVYFKTGFYGNEMERIMNEALRTKSEK
ncbi:MAG: TlpA family protein disulfide reductase [Tannerella sp.]|jgi:thiol-disulfide isomerase/thioredoxin|nr:TlpA family protein disulfide reductase [Tannerella sp.]